MRWVLVAAAVALAGCASQVYQPPPDVVARYDQQMAAFRAERDRYSQLSPQDRAAEDGARRAAAERDRQATAICEARGEMASATTPRRSGTWTGALSTGFDAAMAAERVRAACLDAYRSTGVMPSL